MGSEGGKREEVGSESGKREQRWVVREGYGWNISYQTLPCSGLRVQGRSQQERSSDPLRT